MARVLSAIPAALRARILEMAEQAAELVPGSAYANYMIIDPTRPDPDSILPGTPFYVGQSANISKRIITHVRLALTNSVQRGSLYERIISIVRAGELPIFRVLQIHKTRLESLNGETVWAQRLLLGGARLYNRWPEQSRVMPTRELSRRQQRRLLDLSMGEAKEAGAVLQVKCRKSCWAVTIGAVHLLPRFGERATFHPVRDALRECPQCGDRLRHAVVVEGCDATRPARCAPDRNGGA